MVRAIVALGSNLGDRLGQLRSGVEGLSATGDVVGVSALYETDPVGGPTQGRYLNAVVVLETDLAPVALLTELHRIEGGSHRRREVHWGPRTLDLDLIAYGEDQVSLPDLEVPHPRAHERRFVLAPLLDVAPDVTLADGSTPHDAIPATLDQHIDRWSGNWVASDPSLGPEAAWWVVGQFGLLTVWLVVLLLTARPEPTMWLIPGGLLTVGGLVLGVGAVVAFNGPITPSPQPREGSLLVDSGVYRLVRHPMYGAVWTSTLGVAIAARSWPAIAVCVVLAVLFRFKSAREERILAIVVPGYDDYRRRVRRRFLPGIW